MIEECGHTKIGGGKCGSPALRGKSYCYFHDPAMPRVKRAARPRYFLHLPLLEHPGVIQAAVHQIGEVLTEHRIHYSAAQRLLYALHLATQQLDRDSDLSGQFAMPGSITINRVPGFSRIYSNTKFKPRKGNQFSRNIDHEEDGEE